MAAASSSGSALSVIEHAEVTSLVNEVVSQVIVRSAPALAALFYQAGLAVVNESMAAASGNSSNASSCAECGCRLRAWPVPRNAAHAPPPRPRRPLHGMPALASGARPAAPQASGPTEAERYMTEALVWMNMGYHTNRDKDGDEDGPGELTEPFYSKDVAGPKLGPELDGKFSDESLGHKDSRAGIWPMQGDPRDKTTFMFGPLSSDCSKNHHNRFWSLVGAHWDFWIPFSLTAYIFAPVMGFTFYCMLKGSKYFGICMDRMLTGASITAAIREMYNGRPDPWAGQSPDKS